MSRGKGRNTSATCKLVPEHPVVLDLLVSAVLTPYANAPTEAEALRAGRVCAQSNEAARRTPTRSLQRLTVFFITIASVETRRFRHSDGVVETSVKVTSEVTLIKPTFEIDELGREP